MATNMAKHRRTRCADRFNRPKCSLPRSKPVNMRRVPEKRLREVNASDQNGAASIMTA